MSTEMTNSDLPPMEPLRELPPQQQVVETAAKLAVVAIDAAHDPEERSALVETLKAELGSTGIAVHDMVDPTSDERRGPKGYTRDQIIMMRSARFGRSAVRRTKLGWKT